MSLSLRGIKSIMQETAPGVKISEDAVRIARIHLEREVKELTQYAEAVHDGENGLLKKLGRRPLVVLSARHMRMAIKGDWKSTMTEEDGVASSED